MLTQPAQLKRNFILSILFVSIACIILFAQEQKIESAAPVISPETEIYLGLWEGFIEGRGQKFQIVFEIRVNPDKTICCLFQMPAQGVTGIETKDFSISGNTIRTTIPVINWQFEGTLSSDKKEIISAFSLDKSKLSITFKKVEKISAVLRKQTPIPPYPYEEKEVEFINKHDGTKLSGSLTYPQNGAQFPSVILITGASPQDRNEEGFGGHRFFQVLADDLTKRGIAVLRYDDRGFGKSTGNYDSASIFDFSNDAEAGLDFLKTVPFIDHNKIGLLGHSEGGYVALIVASRRSDVSFIVSMAGPFMPGIDVLRFQHKGALERMAALGERGDEKIPALLDETLNIIIKEDDITVIKNKIEILMKNAAISDEMKKSIIEMYSTPESIFAVKSNPADYLAKINCPILSLGGTRDMAVPVKENQEALKKIMSKLGRANYEMVEFPDMNHFFQTTANGMFYFVPQIQETMAPLAMQTIGEWILRITKATCDSYCHLFYRYSYFPLRVE